MAPSVLLNRKLNAFADAGFGTLAQNRIAEYRVITLGDVIERDGVVKCHGLMIGRRCEEIRRVCRSALAAEARAAATAVDAALRFQVLLTEAATHHFDYIRLTPPTEFP